jgi:hypothetical protein
VDQILFRPPVPFRSPDRQPVSGGTSVTRTIKIEAGKTVLLK